MATANDVAAYVLEQRGPMTAMKMQKLCYYSQAWHLVWDEEPLFSDRVEAWANGPVVPTLYAQHRGTFVLSTWSSGKPSHLTPTERGSVDAVLKFYGGMSAHDLSVLSHREEPWRRARNGIPEGTRSNSVITPEMMFEYYDALTSGSNT